MQIVYNAQAGGCWAEMLGGLRFSNTAQRRATTSREEPALAFCEFRINDFKYFVLADEGCDPSSQW